MFYYNFMRDENDYNTCVAKGVCSITPNITALQEVMFIMLCALAYYVIKLELLGAKNDRIKLDMVYNIVYLSSLQEYNDEQIIRIINNIFSNFINTERLYKSICNERGLKFEKYNAPIKFANNTELSKLIREGDKAFKNKYKGQDKEVKNYAEILFAVIKSLAALVIELDDNDVSVERANDEIIKALNLYNHEKLSAEKIKAEIYEISDLNAELMKQINSIKFEKFGEVHKVEVSQSTTRGKAILVSGNNLSELKEVLEAAKDSAIDVYTNGNLLIAHAYSEFSNYKNLKGHFGNGVETSVLDFATFPGAILLTKNETHNVEYLYRGRIFTTDEIPPKGVAQLNAENLEPLINGALSTKGFTKGQNRKSVEIGFNWDEVERKFEEISQKLSDSTYRHLFIIGLSSPRNSLDEYFANFFSALPDDIAVISFSYSGKCKNTYKINVANDYSLVTVILSRLLEKIPIESSKLTFFLTRCDSAAFAGMIRLHRRGAKNIYMSDCLPTIMNPTTLKAFKKLYNIKNMSNAREDLDKILH